VLTGWLYCPWILLDSNFYTDSIGDKPVKMLETNKAHGTQNEDQEKLCPGDGPAHDLKYPFIEEFSELLRKVSTDVLKSQLMTHRQRLLAESLWAAENYGGSEAKCIKHLKEIYGAKWYEVTSVLKHMDGPRGYYEYVLILDHQQQWNKAQKELNFT
jgi:hypothetical protein